MLCCQLCSPRNAKERDPSKIIALPVRKARSHFRSHSVQRSLELKNCKIHSGPAQRTPRADEKERQRGPGSELRAQVWPTLPRPFSSLPSHPCPTCLQWALEGSQGRLEGRDRPHGSRGPAEKSPPAANGTPHPWGLRTLAGPEHPTPRAPGQPKVPSVRLPLQDSLYGIRELLWGAHYVADTIRELYTLWM